MQQGAISKFELTAGPYSDFEPDSQNPTVCTPQRGRKLDLRFRMQTEVPSQLEVQCHKADLGFKSLPFLDFFQPLFEDIG